MSDKARWLHTQMQGELQARKNSLLGEKAILQEAQARILAIDETIELIDAELAGQAQKLDALPKPVEVATDGFEI